MLHFDRFTLSNGLRCLVHHDDATPMVAVNVLYDVGARDEDAERTGFAHLFEHLMFGGSENIPEYDEPLQVAGGENNAYTTNDITNYYVQLPKQNMETAFWLESDRMNALAFSTKSLDVQRKVVSEEFKEHYLNKPYGDAWMHLRRLAYKKHPYQWMTIGKELKHIEDASLQDVRDFFYKHYRPANAILCVAGNVNTEEVREMAEKWFGSIPTGTRTDRNLPTEPAQEGERIETVYADVPLDALYKAWHIGPRRSPQYYAADLLTEILGNGFSSRFYQQLVKEKELFSGIQCYHTGSIDPGLLVVEGKIIEGKSLDEANAAVEAEVMRLAKDGVSDEELQKAKNKIEAAVAFEDMSLLNRAANLAFYELLGDAAMINDELQRYQAITKEELQDAARNIFRPENCSTVLYRKKE
jgi:predicted Zn-dependent peptidase